MIINADTDNSSSLTQLVILIYADIAALFNTILEELVLNDCSALSCNTLDAQTIGLTVNNTIDSVLFDTCILAQYSLFKGIITLNRMYNSLKDDNPLFLDKHCLDNV